MKRILWLVAAAVLVLVPAGASAKAGNIPMHGSMRQASSYR